MSVKRVKKTQNAIFDFFSDDVLESCDPNLYILYLSPGTKINTKNFDFIKTNIEDLSRVFFYTSKTNNLYVDLNYELDEKRQKYMQSRQNLKISHSDIIKNIKTYVTSTDDQLIWCSLITYLSCLLRTINGIFHLHKNTQGYYLEATIIDVTGHELFLVQQHKHVQNFVLFVVDQNLIIKVFTTL